MYEGTGSYKAFVRDCSNAMEAFQNGTVELPRGCAGTPTLKIEGEGESAKLVLNLRNTAVFSMQNITINGVPYQPDMQLVALYGMRVELRGGRLLITYNVGLPD